ncbi:hypothetical protein ZWY2020_001048 [Hordeum vulgare]|nr:hypothetical protein ZWY2020_001048 [Hordeum vulgare]
MGGDYCLRSIWNVDGYELEVLIYPGTTWVALKLVFLSQARTQWGVRASMACQLVDLSRELEPCHEYAVSETFHHPQDFGALVFMDRNKIPSGYIKDDMLTLRCAITVLKELPAPTIPAEEVIAQPSTNLHQHLGELLQSEMGADVTFLVCDESFAAHKYILAARSPVFKAQFFGEMKDKCSARVEIKDMEPAAFRAMLHFMYTDTVPELDRPLEEGPCPSESFRFSTHLTWSPSTLPVTHHQHESPSQVLCILAGLVRIAEAGTPADSPRSRHLLCWRNAEARPRPRSGATKHVASGPVLLWWHSQSSFGSFVRRPCTKRSIYRTREASTVTTLRPSPWKRRAQTSPMSCAQCVCSSSRAIA